jgi:hypothetical protein
MLPQQLPLSEPENNIQEVLQPLLPVFREIYTEALEKMNKTLLEIQEPLTKRGKAILFYDFLMNRAKKYFPTKDIQIEEKYESIALIIKGQFRARFKKLNSKGRPSNYNTPRNRKIVYQQYQLWPWPTAAQFTFIDIGYSIDLTWSSFQSLQIVCLEAKKVKWSIPIDMDAPKSVELNIQETPHEAPSIEIKERVKLKGRNKKNNSKGA